MCERELMDRPRGKNPHRSHVLAALIAFLIPIGVTSSVSAANPLSGAVPTGHDPRGQRRDPASHVRNKLEVASDPSGPVSATEPAQRLASSAPPTATASPEAPAVVGWGQNLSGQLGGGFFNNYVTWPVLGPAFTGVKGLTVGYHFSLALLEDGTVHGWGGNSFGQLGDGLRAESLTPMEVVGLTGVTAVAASGMHTVALLGDGTVATWGANIFGQLGNGTTGAGSEYLRYSSTVPVYLKSLSGVVAVAAGGANDAALLRDGTVMAWGENSAGQIGDGTTTEKDVPTKVHGLSNVKAIAIGGFASHGGHLLALLNDGTVMAVGTNRSGQLGDGTTENRSVPVPVKGLSGVVAVSASQSHSMALLSDGTIRAWGNNASGELGVGAGPEACSTALTRWACSRVPARVEALGNVTSVSAGWRFSLAVSAGRLFSWGSNEFGRLGNGTILSSSVPVAAGPSSVMSVAAGEEHSVALLSRGAPAPEVEMSSGVGSLTISWRSSYLSEQWDLARRPVTDPRSKWCERVALPAATRSYTLSGLTSGQPYEVIVRNALFGYRIMIGTPG